MVGQGSAGRGEKLGSAVRNAKPRTAAVAKKASSQKAGGSAYGIAAKEDQGSHGRLPRLRLRRMPRRRSPAERRCAKAPSRRKEMAMSGKTRSFFSPVVQAVRFRLLEREKSVWNWAD